MKSISLIGLAIAGLVSALPVLAKESGYTVVPGQRIGGVRIGAKERTLARLGAADTGDAAMMKAWMTWYSKPPADQPYAVPAELDVYISLHGVEEKYKRINEVRVTSSAFKLANGIATGAHFEHILSSYPHLKLIKTYSTKKSNGPIQIYDDTKHGIAFEIYRGRDGKASSGLCSAIIVHRPGSLAGEEYLGLTEYLQGLSETPDNEKKR